MPAVPPDPGRPAPARSRRRPALARSGSRLSVGPVVPRAARTAPPALWRPAAVFVTLVVVAGLGGLATSGGPAAAAVRPTTTATTGAAPGSAHSASTTTPGPRSTGPASPSTTTTTTTLPPRVAGLSSPTFLPVPAGSVGFSPAAVNCPTIFSCVVVGSIQMSGGSRVAAVSVQTGATWATIPVPLPASSLGITGGVVSELTAVSCATDASCVAIGGFGPAGGTVPTQGLVESGSGTSWSGSSVPLPQNASTDAKAGSTLSGLNCPGPDSCVVAGSYVGPADAQFPLLVTGSPGSWADAPVSLPSDAEAPPAGSGSSGTGATGQPAPAGALTGVACASPSGCAVVGDYATSAPGHPTSGLVLWGSGAAWSPQSVPGPPGYGVASMGDVACSAPQSCVAIGMATQSAGAANPAVPLLAEGSGSSWSVVTTPLPPGATDPSQIAFDAVACATNSDCSVFGHYGASAGSTPAGYFTLTVSGGNLTVEQARTFLAWPGNPWGNVQCPQAAMVCVTGYDGPGSQSLALGWGANWATSQVPVPGGEPADASMRLVGVNCGAPTSCVVLLAGTLGPPGNPGTPDQSTPQNAVVQTVTLPDLTATPPTTTAPAPLPAAAPTTLPPFTPTAPTTTTVPDLQRGSLGALSAQKQPVGTATIVLAVIAGLLLLALVLLWVRIARAKQPQAAGTDEPGKVIALGGTRASAAGAPPQGAVPPVGSGEAPIPGEPTGAVPALTELAPAEGPPGPPAPPVPAPFFPVPPEPPPAAPSSPVVPPPAAWAPAAVDGGHGVDDAPGADATPGAPEGPSSPQGDDPPPGQGPETSVGPGSEDGGPPHPGPDEPDVRRGMPPV